MNWIIRPRKVLKQVLSPDWHLVLNSIQIIQEKNLASKTVATGPLIDLAKISPTRKENMVYVSLGTLVDTERKIHLLKDIQKVCEKKKIPTIISWGAWDADQTPALASTPFAQVVGRVDQLEVLHRAKLMITHGGLNSVQECIVTETPMIVIPLKHDQHFVASRIEKLGLGRVVRPGSGFEKKLEQALELEINFSRQQALQLQKGNMLTAGGMKAATEFITSLQVSHS